MKIKTILIAGIILFLLGWLVFGKKKKTMPETVKTLMVSPTPTEIQQRYSDDTGAIYISPTKDEKVEIDEIYDLRKKSPVETEDFVVDFDYGESIFMVEFKDSEKDNKRGILNEWLKENGYGDISEEFIEIKQ